MKKNERYGWAVPGDDGIQQSVLLDALEFDLSYQRDQTSEVNVLAIARAFRWDAFGVIVVMRRSDGRLFVVDGQHRVMAARRHGGITRVPAIVFESQGRDHEAAAFVALNTARKSVPALVKFKARALAGLQPESDIVDWARDNGYKFARSSGTPKAIDFPSVLCKSWLTDREAAKRALTVQDDLVGTDGLCGAIHKGIAWLEHNGIQCADHVQRLRHKGIGRAVLMKEMRKMFVESDTTSERTCGIAVLRVINHGLRNRIKTPKAGGSE